jgi:hypothetical protein
MGLTKWIIVIAIIAAVIWYIRADPAQQGGIKSFIGGVIDKTQGLIQSKSSTSTTDSVGHTQTLGKPQAPIDCTVDKDCIFYFGRNDARCDNITGSCYVKGT